MDRIRENCNISKRHNKRLVAKRLKEIKKTNYFGHQLNEKVEDGINLGFERPNVCVSPENVIEEADVEILNENELVNCESKTENAQSVNKLDTLKNNLKQVIILNNISAEATSGILNALNEYGIKLPRTKQNLIKDIGYNEHSVLKKRQNILKNCNNKNVMQYPKIVLDINIDGLPLFKSSKTCIWPILGSIVNTPDVYPFVIVR